MANERQVLHRLLHLRSNHATNEPVPDRHCRGALSGEGWPRTDREKLWKLLKNHRMVPGNPGQYRRPRADILRTLPVYVSTTSLSGVPSGSVSSARCSRSRAGKHGSPISSIRAGGIASHPSGSTGETTFAEIVWRLNARVFATRPNGVSVVSRSLFISGVRGPGTYQLSASESTSVPQRSLTLR